MKIAQKRTLDDTSSTPCPKLLPSEAAYAYGVSHYGSNRQESWPPNGNHPWRHRKEKENYLHTVNQQNKTCATNTQQVLRVNVTINSQLLYNQGYKGFDTLVQKQWLKWILNFNILTILIFTRIIFATWNYNNEVHNHNCNVINIIIMNINNYQIRPSTYVTSITTSGDSEQAITHFRECPKIRINIQPYRGESGQHDIRAPSDKPRMIIFCNDIVGSTWVPPLSSARLPHNTSHWTIWGCPIHYPGVHLYKNGEVSSNHYNNRATSVYWVP
jgi:hypothetical protein